MPLRPGDAFDRYVVEEVLGQGGMGVVYRARDDRLHRSVALKVLAPATEDGPASGSVGPVRLLREARAAAALDHPNVVAVFDVGDFEGTPFIAMELVEGRTLRAAAADPSVSLQRRVRWLAAVARALGAAHARGLVHRDVKPENVMIRPDDVVKVLDFGIARRAHAAGAGTQTLGTITGEGIVVGTPLYMAPEQFLGETVDALTDQFAWGVVAFEVLTGCVPWIGSGASVVAAIASKDLPAMTGVSPALEGVVRRATSKSPGARFPTMEEAAAALEQAAADTSRLALAPTEAQRIDTDEVRSAVRAPPRRRLGTFPLALGAALALAAAAGVVRWSLRAASPAASGAAPASANPPPAPAATACNAQHVPESAVPEAAVAFRGALQSYCDADRFGARAWFRRAASLDPSMAAAQLWSAFFSYGAGDVTGARNEERTARQLRASLTEREAVLLESLTPMLSGSRPDWKAAIDVLGAAIARWPLDADLHARRAFAEWELNDVASMRQDCLRAVELDPSFALPLGYLGAIERLAEHDDAAVAEYDRCLAIAPNASSCLLGRDLMLGDLGQCDRLDADAERLIALQAPNGYEIRANLLAARGAPVTTLRAAAEPMLRGGDEAQREEWGWRLAAWSGDLGRAESSARAALAAMGPGATLTQQSLATWAIVQVLLEEGRAHDAGAVALDFLDRRTLLTPSVADSVGQDATPVLLAVAARAGLLSEAQRRARRDAFLEAWSTLAPGEEDRRSANIDAFVAPVESKEEALEAVARLPDLLPLGPDWYGRRAFLVGKVCLLAGRAEEAVANLRRATAACFPLTHAIDSARAAAMLGRALDATGDRAGACDAYRAVLERWRGATPRSVTLEDARRAAAADGCGR